MIVRTAHKIGIDDTAGSVFFSWPPPFSSLLVSTDSPPGNYAIVESVTIATAVSPPKIGSNMSITSRASFFFSTNVMIRFLTYK